MKPKLLFLAIYILIVPFFTTAQTDTSVYAVFMKGTVKGTQKIWKTDENTYHYFYQIFDRGRGDSLLTKLKTIIQEAQIPESYYNSKNSNYGSNWIHSPPLATGVANGAIETVKDIPVLVSFGADVALNSTTRHQLKEGLKQLNSWENIKTAASSVVKNWEDKYREGGDVAWHQAGKDAVAVYCVAKTVAVLASSLKKGVEKEVDEIAEEVEEQITEINDLTNITTSIKKSGEDFNVLANARKLPGIVSGNGKNITGKWLRGTQGNAGLFPKSVADKLKGKQFENFDKFREAFWKEVANDPDLSSQFSPQNLGRMKNGNAPIAVPEQWLGGQQSYVLHHKTPINQGGSVYDVDNLYIVTPKYHKEILDPAYHYEYGY